MSRMSLWSRYRSWINAEDVSFADEVDVRQSDSRAAFSITLEGAYWNPATFGYDPTEVSETIALRVPAFLEARNKVCGTIGSLPLVNYDKARRKKTNLFLAQPERDFGRTTTLTKTVADLAMYSVAYWVVTERYADGVYPRWVSRVCPLDVTVNEDEVYVKGDQIDPRDLIQFHSPNPALLTVGAGAIKRAALLAALTDLYAGIPQMSGYFRASDGEDPADFDAETFLTEWATARAKGVTGYVPAGLEYVPIRPGMTPVEMELAPSKQACDVDMARLWGLDPEELGISTTSRTYANVVDRRQDFINQTLASLMNAVTERLSMGDITPAGQTVEFDLAQFLRGNPNDRAAYLTAMISAGILSADEARDAEGYSGPAPKKVVNE